MTSAQTTKAQERSLMGQAEPPPSVLFGETEIELWPYRRRTVALLRRYARASVEVGRLPSLLGREFFRSRVTSYTMRNFEDVVIFVTDMEQAIEKLSAREKKLLAMNVLEEYSIPEVARLLSCTQRTVERFLQDALDQLSRILLAGGLMERLPIATRGRNCCQEGKNYNFGVSDSNEGKNKCRKVGGTPPSDLIS
jgi:Sigma-70, region 4